MDTIKIADILAGSTTDKRFDGFYLLSSAECKTTQNGKQFLNCTLQDNSGSVSAKLWDYTGTIHENIGQVVKIRARADEYQGHKQVIIDMIRLAAEQDTYAIEEIVPAASQSDVLMQNLTSLLSEIEDQDYAKVAAEVYTRYGNDFLTIPAAKKVHHAFLRGLLMHTVGIMKMCKAAAAVYPVNKSLLLLGAFLHDIGKIEEFACSELGMVTDYTKSGKLLGHLVIGAMMVRDICRENNIPEEKELLLEHMLISHHGEPEYGSAVKPAFIEAEILSQLDMLDSRVEIYLEATENMQPGDFSEKVYALSGRSVLKT